MFMGVKQVEHRPPGYRMLTSMMDQETVKAVRFRYYDWVLWLPKKAVVQLPDDYDEHHHGACFAAAGWAIETSKNHPSAICVGGHGLDSNGVPTK